MNPNTHSTRPPGSADRLGLLEAAKQQLAAENLDQLTDTALAEDTLRQQRLLDGLAGEWLRRLAAVDAHGAAGAEQDQPALSTASWLRARLRMGAGAATSSVRSARALFRGGPLTETAAALLAREISPAHAAVVADGTRELAPHVAMDADPVLTEAARHLDPPRLRQAVTQLVELADPEGADQKATRDHARRGLWLSPTWDGMVAVDGLLEAEAGHLVQEALEPLARPAEAGDDR